MAADEMDNVMLMLGEKRLEETKDKVSTKELVLRSLTLFVTLNPSKLVIRSSPYIPKSVVKGCKGLRLTLSLAEVGPHECSSEPIKAPSRIVYSFSNFGDEPCAGRWQLGTPQSAFEHDESC